MTPQEASEKLIPKKPIGDFNSVPHYRCPNCFGEVKLFSNSKIENKCKYCGQKLEWEDKK